MKLNKIVISAKDFNDRISTIGEVQIVDEFIFDRFILQLENIPFEITLQNGTNKGIAISQIGETEHALSWDCQTGEVFGSFENEDIVMGYVELILKTLHYIMTTPREKIQKCKGNRSYENKKTQTGYRPHKIYLLKDIVEYVNEEGAVLNDKGTHAINCPCWSVRGHYRHYKSGKVVFIKNYEKGKQRGKEKPQNKAYIV